MTKASTVELYRNQVYMFLAGLKYFLTRHVRRCLFGGIGEGSLVMEDGFRVGERWGFPAFFFRFNCVQICSRK